MSAKREFYKTRSGYRWRLRAKNNRIIDASTESFASRQMAENNFRLVAIAMQKYLKVGLIIFALGFLTGCSDKSPTPPTNPPGVDLIDNADHVGPAGLYCLVGRAHADNCSELIELLVETKIRRTAFNTLIDGGFNDPAGDDVGRLLHYVDRISSGGRIAALAINVFNGPSARGYSSTPVDGPGTKIEPGHFRWVVQSDPGIRQLYKDAIKRFKPVYELLLARGGKLYIIPQLEDNLDDQAFASLHQLTLEAWHETNVHALPMQVVRNPCVGCYPGNTEGLPSGVTVEHHKPSQWTYTGSTATNDGIELLLPGQSTRYPRQWGIFDLPKPAGNTFYLWFAKYQGLGGGPGGPVDSRNYAKPTAAEKEAIKQFYLKPSTTVNRSHRSRAMGLGHRNYM